MLSSRTSDYPLISQGKTRIPGINDALEFELTVVSYEPRKERASSLRYPCIGPCLHQNFWQTREKPAPCKSSKGFMHRFSIHDRSFESWSSTGTNTNKLICRLTRQSAHTEIDDRVRVPRSMCIKYVLHDFCLSTTEQCLLSNDVHDYYNVAQGKITIPNVDDGEECLLTDVSDAHWKKLYPLVALLSSVTTTNSGLDKQNSFWKKRTIKFTIMDSLEST